MTAVIWLAPVDRPNTEAALLAEARAALGERRWSIPALNARLELALANHWRAAVDYLLTHGLAIYDEAASETAFGAACAIHAEGHRALKRLGDFTPGAIWDACTHARIPVAAAIGSGGSKGGWSYRQAMLLVGCPTQLDGTWTWRKVASIGAPHRSEGRCRADLEAELPDAPITDNVRTGGLVPAEAVNAASTA